MYHENGPPRLQSRHGRDRHATQFLLCLPGSSSFGFVKVKCAYQSTDLLTHPPPSCQLILHISGAWLYYI